jgi:1,4-dihydroxy-6-naphthoate synthase
MTSMTSMTSKTSPSPDDRILLRLGHSPDPDDAFMWWPLFGIDGEGPEIVSSRFRFEQVEIDIEAANRRAEIGPDRLEITAFSCGQYPRVAGHYAITACGSSMGEGYGPKLVAARPMAMSELAAARPRIAIPGNRTTAAMTLGLRLQGIDYEAVETPFEEVGDRVLSGLVDAGVVIHEGQLTYEADGLHLVEDLGAWWWAETGEPLPLGVNAVRRDLEQLHGEGTLQEIAGLLERSVGFAIEHRDRSVSYAMGFGRGVPRETADRFIELYVNQLTVDAGARGLSAVNRLLTAAADAGLVPVVDQIDFVRGTTMAEEG